MFDKNIVLVDLQELRQYPGLRVEVTNAACDSLERMREESKKATLQLVDMECSYLTVDFFRKLPQDVDKGGNPSHSLFDRYNDSYLRRIGKSLKLKISIPYSRLWFSFAESFLSDNRIHLIMKILIRALNFFYLKNRVNGSGLCQYGLCKFAQLHSQVRCLLPSQRGKTKLT